jgi:cytoskeletal protein CcmA (bactofilin family)
MFGWFGKKEIPKEEEEAAFTLPLPSVKAGTSFLGSSLVISGSITGQGDVQLHGLHEGSIDLQGDLDIRQSAVVTGLITARSISVSGSVDGDLRARQKLSVLRTARITGTVATPRVLVEEGALLEGTVKMDAA